MKKNIVLIIVSIAIFAFVGFKLIVVKKDQKRFTIGILQTASHPALDAARQGFIEVVSKQLGENVSFIVQNAEGQAPLAHAIAKQFARNADISGLFAIATPALQALCHVEKRRPIAIAAVSNPSKLGLNGSVDNIFGARDASDVVAQVQAIQKILPTCSTFALLHSPSEINSVESTNMILAQLEKVGLKGIRIGVANESDVIASTLAACRQADAIIVPTDNVLALAMRAVTSTALKQGKPVIGSDSLLADQGPLLVAGSADYKGAGAHAGQCLVDVLLHGKDPAKIGFSVVTDKRVVVNRDSAKTLGIALPKNSSVVFVRDKS